MILGNIICGNIISFHETKVPYIPNKHVYENNIPKHNIFKKRNTSDNYFFQHSLL